MRTYCVVFRARDIFRVEANDLQEARSKAEKYLNDPQRSGSWELEDILDLSAAVPMCPLHQRLMTLRKGDYGSFWSCGQKTMEGKYCSYRPPGTTA